MVRLKWEDRDYEAGLDRGVFYPSDTPPEVWNGLTAINESSEELSSHIRYRDGVKYVNRRSMDSFSATIEAFTYPPALFEQRRRPFGLSYRVLTADGYKIHLVYNALVRMSESSYEQAETTPFSFDISTKPVSIPGAKASAHLIIDTEVAYPWTVTAFEELLYGSESTEARLPAPEEVFDIFEVNSIFRVIDHGDGSFTVTGPDEAVQIQDATTYQLTWPSVVFIDEVSYQVSSL